MTPRHLWVFAVEITLLVSLVPVGVALLNPLGRIRRRLSAAGQARWDAALRSVPVRVLTFPVVAAVLVTAWLMVVFLTGLIDDARHHLGVLALVYLVSFLLGLLAALPLLGVELLPAWVTDPFKLLFAFVDGLLDAIPGIAVMTRPGATSESHTAGALMLALSEVVALPLFLIVFFRWASREMRRQRERPADDEPEFTTPWWETEDSDAPGERPGN